MLTLIGVQDPSETMYGWTLAQVRPQPEEMVSSTWVVTAWYPGAETCSVYVPAVRGVAPDHEHSPPYGYETQSNVSVTGPVSVACAPLIAIWGMGNNSTPAPVETAGKTHPPGESHALSATGARIAATASTVPMA